MLSSFLGPGPPQRVPLLPACPPLVHGDEVCLSRTVIDWRRDDWRIRAHTIYFPGVV
jgi:hypothetical protein